MAVATRFIAIVLEEVQFNDTVGVKMYNFMDKSAAFKLDSVELYNKLIIWLSTYIYSVSIMSPVVEDYFQYKNEFLYTASQRFI